MTEEKPERNPKPKRQQKLENEPASLVAINDAQIKSMIYTVRGDQVMLDSDLAKLYGVETKVLNQAVGRNVKRFPERFCFRLTKEEAVNLRSQIVTLRPELGEQGSWWRYMPRVFTEQGISMLSAVLRSPTAIEVSIKVMDAFVEMRHFIADNAHMFEQIRSIDQRLYTLERSTDDRFERIFDYMEAHEAPSQKVFFEGQVFDAFELLVSLSFGRRKEALPSSTATWTQGRLTSSQRRSQALPLPCGRTPRPNLPSVTLRPSTRNTQRSRSDIRPRSTTVS